MAIQDKKVTTFSKKVTDLADKPNETGGLSASQVKEYFHTPSEELRVAHNGLIDEIEANYYDKPEVDTKLNNATKTTTVQAGTAFPAGPYNEGQMFWRSDEKKMYAWSGGSGQFEPVLANGHGNGLNADMVDGHHICSLLGLVERSLLTGVDGNVTISANTTIPRNVMMYDNLTIDAGVTLTAASGLTVIGVKNTLTLNGTISADGKGGAGGGSGGQLPGGSGGGILIVIADKIEGTGTMSANGTNGTNGFAGANSGTGNSVGGSIYQKSITGGNNGVTSNGGTVSGGTGLGTSFLNLIRSSLISFGVNDIGGAGGGGGYGNNSSGLYGVGGGGGGGIVGNGGSSVGPTSSFTGSFTGGGGGGGGAVIVFALNPIPAITLIAKGGNGGNAYQHGSGGSGGGGGLVFINAPSSLATINVAGGNAGTSVNGSSSPGTAGASMLAQTV